MLEGKIALVTGAASGIGKALSEALFARGAVVVALDLAAEPLEALRAEAAKRGAECLTLVVDVTDAAAVKKARDEAVSRLGRIDLWFNNAGISGLGGFVETPLAELERVIAVNLGAVVSGTKIALEHMESRGAGTIVNMASVAGHVAAPYLTIYSATKHGVVGLTRALREELAMRDSPVKLRLVSPGFVDTAMVARGQKIGFPDWLSWALATPEGVAKEILDGIQKGKDEIFPSLNGKLMMKVHSVFPRATRKSARVLLARKFKDLLLNRYTVE